MAPGSADGSHYTCCSQVTCSRLCARPCSDYSRARGSAPLAHCHSSSGMRRRAHTPTLVRHHDMHADMIMDHRSRQRACVHRQHPTRPRRQPIRSRTCTDFDMWTCLACTDFDRSARCSSAQLDMAAELLSSLGSALFSLLCSGSALFATARGSSTRASAASLGLRLCLARVALFGLTGSAHDFRLSLARVTNRLGPRLLSWAAGAARLSAWLGSATPHLCAGPRLSPSLRQPSSTSPLATTKQK